jgi:hypothetical protein
MARGRKKKATGLGDTVESIIQATHIDKVAKWLFGEDCGCEARKEKLNKLFPYRKPLCLTEDEYLFLGEFFNRENQSSIKPTQSATLLKIYNRIFQLRQEPTTCAQCWKEYLNKLNQVYNEYKAEEESEANRNF